MGYAIMIAQFVLSLSILIILHELGHFIPAKWFKTRVEKFYLFFDPWISLFKKKIGETEYGIGWLPLGGYVKISGMIDESMDKEQMKGPPQPWEFRSKPAWQRLIIMLGGVTVNFILGFLLFGMVLFIWGSEYLPTQNIPNGYYVDSLAMEMGLQNGDKILEIGDHAFDRYDIGKFKKEIVINDAKEIKVERDDNVVSLPVDEKFVSKLSSYAYKDAVLFIPRTPTIIKAIAKKSAAEKAGLKPEDRIVAINDIETPFYDQFRKVALDNKNSALTLRYIRDGQEQEVRLQSDENGIIGFEAKNYLDLYETERQEYTVAQAIPAGVVKGYDFLASQIKAFGKMFRGKIKATESLGGFGTISNLFPKVWSWEVFWHVTAVLSLILGFMNLLPIPALDGGHVMFLIYEVVTGRKVSDKFMEYATIVGFAIVIGLVLFANGLDVLRWLNSR
ncbi:MAG: RIP metalloprotease RseP [Saprospiraceae bacterium]|nr:RIP metalloprotease RseP [Saprospiraceae bacterium]